MKGRLRVGGQSCAPLVRSLVCVRRHKSERQCSGWRNKAAFVALSSFTDRHLLSGQSSATGVPWLLYDSPSFPPPPLPSPPLPSPPLSSPFPQLALNILL